MVCWGGATECEFQCVLFISFALFPLAMTVSILDTVMVRGGDNDNNEEDGDLVNTSFHEIEEEASHKVVHFEEGQTICLSLCFKSSQYSAEHVRRIVLESPMEGWQVSYHEELFTTATYLCKDKHTY